MKGFAHIMKWRRIIILQSIVLSSDFLLYALRDGRTGCLMKYLTYSSRHYSSTETHFNNPPSFLLLCPQVYWAGHRETGQKTQRAHPRVWPSWRPGQHETPHGSPRNLQHQRLLLRSGEPRRQHPHPSPGGPGSERVLRGPAPCGKLRPVRRDEGHRAHLPAGFRGGRGVGAERCSLHLSMYNT